MRGLSLRARDGATRADLEVVIDRAMAPACDTLTRVSPEATLSG